jgi:hypothetical protein
VFRGSGFGLVGGTDDGGRAAPHFGFQKNEGLWGDGLPLMGEWVPTGDDGRNWRWLSASVTVGRGEMHGAVGGENGVGEEKGGKRKGFSATVILGRGFGGGKMGCRRRCWWMENLGASGERTGVEGKWVWGEIFGGGNEIVPRLFSVAHATSLAR